MVGVNLAEIVTAFCTAGFQEQVTFPTDALLLKHPGILLPSIRKVIRPAWSTAAIMLMAWPLGGVVVPPASERVTVETPLTTVIESVVEVEVS